MNLFRKSYKLLLLILCAPLLIYCVLRQLWFEFFTSTESHTSDLYNRDNFIQSGDCYCRYKDRQIRLHDILGASTYQCQCLPRFIIVGSMKSGTGELMRLLNQHPLLQAGHGDNGANEIHYFGRSWKVQKHTNLSQSKSKFWSAKQLEYMKYFVTTQRLIEGLNEDSVDMTMASGNRSGIPLMFDKSPDYMRSMIAMYEMSEVVPEAKILVILRSPAQRAVSEFVHNCRHGRYARLLHDVILYSPGNTKRQRNYSMIYKMGHVFSVYGEHAVYGNDLITDTISQRRNNLSGHHLHGSIHEERDSTHKFPRKSFKILRYPCSGEDLHRYFKPSAALLKKSRHVSQMHFTGPLEIASDIVSASPSSRRRLRKDHNTTSTHETSPRILAPRFNVEGRLLSSEIFTKKEPVATLPFEISHGFYDEQLKGLLSLYRSEQVMVILHEELLRNTAHTLRVVEAFLDVSHYGSYQFSEHGEYQSQGSKSYSAASVLRWYTSHHNPAAQSSVISNYELNSIPSVSDPPLFVNGLIDLQALWMKDPPAKNRFDAHNATNKRIFSQLVDQTHTIFKGDSSNRSRSVRASTALWTSLDAPTRDLLNNIYAPHISRLASLLHKHFPHKFAFPSSLGSSQ